MQLWKWEAQWQTTPQIINSPYNPFKRNCILFANTISWSKDCREWCVFVAQDVILKNTIIYSTEHGWVAWVFVEAPILQARLYVIRSGVERFFFLRHFRTAFFSIRNAANPHQMQLVWSEDCKVCARWNFEKYYKGSFYKLLNSMGGGSDKSI